MNITFLIDQAAALRAGIDAPSSTGVLHVDPATLAEGERAILAAILSDGHDATKYGAMIYRDGSVGRDSYPNAEQKLRLIAPTIEALRTELARVAALLDKKREAERAADAQSAARVAAYVDYVVNTADDELIRSDNWIDNYTHQLPRSLDGGMSHEEYRAAQQQLSERINHLRQLRADRGAAAKVAREAAEAAETAAEAAKQRRRADQLAAFVAEHGTQSQRARSARGVLDDAEVVQAIEAQTFAPLGRYATAADCMPVLVLDSYSDEYPSAVADDVMIDTDELRFLTEAQCDQLEVVEQLMPGAECTPVTARGALRQSSGSDDEQMCVERFGVRVDVQAGELSLSRTVIPE